MAILCGWASSDERGHAHGGKAGDQSNEVKVGGYYDFGQTEVLRWKDRNLAIKSASIVKYWCENKNVGYDQYQRTTLGSWCWHHDWDYHVTAPVETDCSKMMGDAVNCTMKKYLIPNDVYTGNLAEYLMRTGLFVRLTGSKYCDSDQYLMVGDIINNPAKHVIMALQNGRYAGHNVSTYKGGFPSLIWHRDGRYIHRGDRGLQVRRLQGFLRWYGTYKGEIDGIAGQQTDAAICEYQRKEGLTVDGYFGKNSLARAEKVKK